MIDTILHALTDDELIHTTYVSTVRLSGVLIDAHVKLRMYFVNTVIRKVIYKPFVTSGSLKILNVFL